MPDGINRSTFEQASAKIQRLLLFDEIQEIKRVFMERKRVEVYLVSALLLGALKMILFG